MLSHLRLAQARGSLQAPNSLVQDRGLLYLQMVEESERSARRRDRIKELLTRDGVTLEAVRFQFPEYFPPPDPFESAKGADGYDIDKIDDAKVAWSVASEEEDEALSRWIEENQQGGFSMADFDQEGVGEWL